MNKASTSGTTKVSRQVKTGGLPSVTPRLGLASRVLFYISERSLKPIHCNREINLALDEDKDVVPVYL